MKLKRYVTFYATQRIKYSSKFEDDRKQFLANPCDYGVYLGCGVVLIVVSFILGIGWYGNTTETWSILSTVTQGILPFKGLNNNLPDNLPDEASPGDWLGLRSQADLNSPINDSSLCSLSK